MGNPSWTIAKSTRSSPGSTSNIPINKGKVNIRIGDGNVNIRINDGNVNIRINEGKSISALTRESQYPN
jgi:topoisomerase IA-like protein